MLREWWNQFQDWCDEIGAKYDNPFARFWNWLRHDAFDDVCDFLGFILPPIFLALTVVGAIVVIVFAIVSAGPKYEDCKPGYVEIQSVCVAGYQPPTVTPEQK